MSAIVVLDLVLLVVVLVVVLGQVGFRRSRDLALIAVQRGGERAEAALAEHILTGRLRGTAYQQRMAEIAAADHLRHPLTVPLD